MPPSQIFVSTRSRREYPRRRPSAPILPVPLLLGAVILLVWVLAAFALWAGGW
jgi:hypothetical protein